MRSKKGFTLIELLIVVVIIGIQRLANHGAAADKRQAADGEEKERDNKLQQGVSVSPSRCLRTHCRMIGQALRERIIGLRRPSSNRCKKRGVAFATPPFASRSSN